MVTLNLWLDMESGRTLKELGDACCLTLIRKAQPVSKQFERNTVSFDVREDFLIDGGAYMKDVVVTFIDKKEYKERRVTLLGTREALEEMKPGDHLVTFGLVEFQKETEKELKQMTKEEELTI
ncbi:9825_t:CDS:2 [Paraglomus brasilianum]|uniref:9825_t:CDS:1 n=1 Tax=Paraglomus brasilianum TaxID=144538 RepID=A0A9N9BKT6_9GLOM|nr:9825_t:CDS:2 [Paraglomus brasilianum]